MIRGHRCIGLVISMLKEYLQDDFFHAVAGRANEYGCKLFVYHSSEDLKYDDSYSRGEGSVYGFIDYDILDGMIILGESIKDRSIYDRIVSECKKRDIPVVCVDKYTEGCFNIEYRYSTAFESIVRHVIEKHGCRVINVMGGQRGNSFSEERIDCVRRVMAQHGLRLDDDRILYGEFWTKPALSEMDRFARSGLDMPEAFICANDSMAMAVCGWLKNHGYQVPEDIIVTGFDGIFEEKFHIPRLTTAKQNTDLAGEKAVDTIIAVLEGRTVDTFYPVDHAIVFSQSCGCAPIDYRESSGKISPLFGMLNADAEADMYMSYLDDYVGSAGSLQEVSDYIIQYSMMYSWYYYALCISEDFMSISDDYSKYIHSDTQQTETKLILCETLDGTPARPYCSKAPKNFCEAVDKYNILLFWPVHFQELSIGYGITALSTGVDGLQPNDDTRRITKYTRNLNRTLENANSKSVMKKVIDRLQTLYVMDHTGLLNRRGFYSRINDALAEARASGEKKYIIIISMDMDGLKTINDKYGHAQGDVAINAIADALKSIRENNEICSRFGGDEFIVAAITDKDPNDRGLDITDKLKRYLEDFNSRSGKPYRVRASYGIWFELITDHLSVDELIKRADDLMYKEKATHTESRYSGS